MAASVAPKFLLNRLNYYWRIVATGISFSAFGLGGLCLGYGVLPIILLTSRNAAIKKRRVRYAISSTFRFFVFLMQSLGLGRFQFPDAHTIEAERGHLILSNHPTLIDVVVIIAHLPNCNIIIKEALWNNPVMKKILQCAGYIPNSGAEELTKTITQTVAEGQNLLIFPEGTRSIPGQSLKLQRGAANIAVRLQVPIRLLKITCEPSTLTKQLKWYNIPPTPIDYRIEVKARIEPEPFLVGAGSPSLAVRHLTRHLTEALEEDNAVCRQI